jgi:hypothetical protein
LAAAAWSREDWVAAQSFAEAAISVAPRNLLCLYNAGVAEWMTSVRVAGRSVDQEVDGMGRLSSFDSQNRWAQRLRTFVSEARDMAWIPQRLVRDAESMLAGSFEGEPQLAVEPPPEPRESR